MTSKMMFLVLSIFAIKASASLDASVGKFGLSEAWEFDHLNDEAKPLANASKPKLSLIETDEDADPAKKDDDESIDAASDSPDQAPAMPSKFLAMQPADPASGSVPKSLESLSAALGGQDSGAANTAQSRKMTTASMEAAIMELMSGKSAFGATPMGGSVQKIVDILTKTMPKVKDAHKADQDELFNLDRQLGKCFSSRDGSLRAAAPWNVKYKKESNSHKRCRGDEAVRHTSKTSCLAEQAAKYQVKVLKCNFFASESRNYGSTFNNREIVTKTASETVEGYIGRISSTICGKHDHGRNGQRKITGGWGGGLAKGMFDKYLRAKHACEVATSEYNKKVRECREKIHQYNVKKAKCNSFQVDMDARSCKHAILLKDTCEQYAGCYMSRRKAFEIVQAQVKMEERDRKAEWRGLRRISCLIGAFADGQINDKEIDACKAKGVSTDHLTIKYPVIPVFTKCETTKLYPATGAYKRVEFAPLPTLAKGQASVPCSGVEEIPTRPMKGSPKTCRCSRVTLEGHYHAGPLVM